MLTCVSLSVRSIVDGRTRLIFTNLITKVCQINSTMALFFDHRSRITKWIIGCYTETQDLHEWSKRDKKHQQDLTIYTMILRNVLWETSPQTHWNHYRMWFLTKSIRKCKRKVPLIASKGYLTPLMDADTYTWLDLWMELGNVYVSTNIMSQK